MRRSPILVTLCLTAWTITTLIASPAFAAFPNQDLRVLYSRGGDLFTISQLGKNKTRVDLGLDFAYPGAFAPTGTRIAVAGRRPAATYADIFTAKANGTMVRNVTKTPDTDEWSPRWSPNGNRLVFMRLRPDDTYDLFTIKVDGTDQRNITKTPGVNEVAPRWSPDGKRIMFGTDADGEFDIRSRRPDGTHPRTLVAVANEDDFPGDYQPNGKRIVFWRDVGADAFLLDAKSDGSGADYFYVNGGSRATSPITTPGGERIIFMLDSPGADFRGLYRYRNGGSQPLVGGPQSGPEYFTDRWVI